MRLISNRQSVFRLLLCGALAALAAAPDSWSQAETYLDDMAGSLAVKQAWGSLGLKTAAYAPNGPAPLRLRIADKEYDRGLGHHAAGEIVVPLEGKYLAFKAEVGVEWQGGGRGGVVFEAWVDGEKRFDSGRMTDSDPPKPVEIPLVDARELRLVAADGGDGIICDMANWADARLVRDARIPEAGAPAFSFGGASLAEPVTMEGSYVLLGHDGGAQIAFSKPLRLCTIAATAKEEAGITLPLDAIGGPFEVRAEVVHVGGAKAEIWLSLASGGKSKADLSGGRTILTLTGDGTRKSDSLTLGASAAHGNALVRLVRFQYISGDRTVDLKFFPTPAMPPNLPAPRELTPHPLLEQELVAWDWLMQDGIGAGQTGNTFAAAVEKTLARGDALLADLSAQGAAPEKLADAWQHLRAAFHALRGGGVAEDDARWEALWRQAHGTRREMAFANPLADTGPLLFVKQVPGVFSHQLTQYYGRYARPGGGVFVLDQPGRSMQARQLGAGVLPQGSFMQPEVTHDGRRIMVAFCAVDAPPADTFKGEHGRFYHLYAMNADGSGLKQLTDGAVDDFAPKELPNGQFVFISTRRGGMHRCGTPGCEVYTLTLMQPDGGGIHTISYHETQEWDPSVLNDGRIIYTRWDYVDRSAVHYQQLWWVRPDGTAPSAFYGNNTLNPVGVWEARAIPGSQKIMATAAPHHGMTAGSIILVDQTRGVDGLEPLTRITPDTPFPESENVLLPGWRSALAPEPPQRTPEMDRWPGQCYRSPYPLSEKYFLAAYSFDALIGEPKGNAANIFGLYWVDAFGNMELIYRDLNIASLWPMPLRARPVPPVIPSDLKEGAPKEGVYFLKNVYDSDPWLPEGTVKRLRIVQVLPKSTSGANNPTVGVPFASPGKQVLGTVPVEADGSACFSAPAGIGLAFQALDDLGQAVQVMRSVTYLQPGETASCMGCHESRESAPAGMGTRTLAAQRPPSVIEPGPDGSHPLSYPILVQPVLDKLCIKCHGGENPKGPEGKPPIVLTGAPEGRYTQSYNVLVQRVSYSAWSQGKFPEGNCEPLAQPGFFGSRGSALMKMLLAGHNGVKLDADDMDRLTTWIGANALFYGTFNFADQEKQQRGERIAGPDLE